MTIQAQIENLENLAALDVELKELRDAVKQERQGLDAKRSTLASLEERLARSQKNSGDMDKLRGDLMGEVRPNEHSSRALAREAFSLPNRTRGERRPA